MASEQVIGKLSVRVVRGHNLIIADPLTHTSDPYVVLSYGSQVHPPFLLPFPIFSSPLLGSILHNPVSTEEPSVAARGWAQVSTPFLLTICSME
jgi:hypothetical protein